MILDKRISGTPAFNYTLSDGRYYVDAPIQIDWDADIKFKTLEHLVRQGAFESPDDVLVIPYIRVSSTGTETLGIRLVGTRLANNFEIKRINEEGPIAHLPTDHVSQTEIAMLRSLASKYPGAL